MRSKFLGKNAGHQPLAHFAGYLVSLHINNVYVTLSFHLIFIVILTHSQKSI